MGDDRKDQNLPARPASSLMGQLVRQRQGADVVPSQGQQTGIAGQQGSTGMGGKASAPPPGQSGMQRPGGPATNVAGGAKPGAAVETTTGPSRADIERIDAKEDGGYGHGSPSENAAVAGDLGAKFSANQG